MSDRYARRIGRVTLVGAGCGPDLITVAGSRAVQHAEVLIYDSLLDAGTLALAPRDCECINVGKRAGAHSMRQEEITALILERAQEGHNVVRLHGGDSYVFGRGGEEILALQAAGIPYDVIPGVSSAIAVPEHCGIPVTHRQEARSFTVVTGHTADGTGEDDHALAGLKGTLVFLMGIRSLQEITARLIAAGKDPATPAAVLSQGYAPAEGRYDGTLATIAEIARDAATPGILVIGPTAGYHMESTMREVMPLTDVRVTVTGTESLTRRLRDRLEAYGAHVTRLSCLAIVPHPERIPALFAPYSWLVFTSSNGVRIFMETLRERGTDLRALMHVRFAVIGSGTAETLRGYGFAADYMPGEYTAAALGRGLADVVRAGERVAVLRAAEGSRDLNVALDAAHIDYDDLAIYETTADGANHPRAIAAPRDCGAGVAMETEAPCGERAAASESGRDAVAGSGSDAGIGRQTSVPTPTADYLVFSSAAGVRAYLACGHSLDTARNLVVIGEATAAELREHTGRSYLAAREHTADGIVAVILQAQAPDRRADGMRQRRRDEFIGIGIDIGRGGLF